MHIQRSIYGMLADSTRIAKGSTSLTYWYGAASVRRISDEMIACDGMQSITRVLWLDAMHKA